jgi:hypothetical protein
MIHVRARVQNGRLVVDEPTDLPDGAEVQLVEDFVVVPADEVLSAEEIAELKEKVRTGTFISTEELRKRLAAAHKEK